MSETKSKSSLKANVQKFGTFLSGMIMPNIAAIIAWGFTAAIFMYPSGWFPNKYINSITSSMLYYLIPILIAYTGGRAIYEERGAVTGAISVAGTIAIAFPWAAPIKQGIIYPHMYPYASNQSVGIPMFLGAMIMGPLSAWLLKKFDQVFQSKVKAGFEMIYNNFSQGIMAMIMAILGYFFVGPVLIRVSIGLGIGVDWIIAHHVLPLANLVIEPAKVLFLNNAIGNGVLVPLGIQQAAKVGKSVLFLMESNPGPGLGILLAYCLFGKGQAKSSAPGAAIIHFLGGVHEIYFPYVLMKPALVVAAMAGGVTGTFLFTAFGGGLKAAASPGSIIAILLVSAKDAYFGNIVGVLGAAIVSFIIAAIILKADKSSGGDLAAAQGQMQAMKAESKGQTAESTQAPVATVDDYKQVKKIIFACDAGMGSSAMGASLLRDKVKKAGLNLSVTNTAVRNLKDEPGLLVITQEELAERALQKTPNAMHVAVGNFLSTPKYDQVIAGLLAANQSAPTEEVKKAKEAAQTAESVDDLSQIDFSKVKEVNFIRHDQHIGTSTMATSLFKDQMAKAKKSTPVKALHIDELEDDASHLVVVTPAAKQNLKVRYNEIQVVAVKDLLTDDKLKKIVEKLS
ncbi:PTS transporter subunit EIIC [Lactobacillus porci]|uniref:PTS transporter subunit EIIC n=1 Tax=Lactobacillus porci TaxID=2012477 RepID=UPI00399619CE